MTISLSAKLAALAGSLRYETIPTAALDRAKIAILDCICCSLAGISNPSVQALLEFVSSEGGTPQSSVFGTHHRLPASAAALVNGMAAHSLDYDDISPTLLGHPSVCLVPAVFALGEHLGASGKDVLAAYVAGFEVAARLGSLMNPDHYQRGWHATSSLGVFGAAAACSHLLRSDAETTSAALGIAASQAAGLKRNFGMEVKPLHAGFAARGGLQAAKFARAGITANPQIFEGRGGFLAVYGGGTEVASAGPLLADGNFDLVENGISVKRHSCAGGAHCAIDAALDIRRDPAFDVEGISEITCAVHEGALAVLIHHEPKTELEAKFSLEYCVAIALIDGVCGLAQFSDERVRDVAPARLLQKVKIVVDPSMRLDSGVSPARLTVRMANGTMLSASVTAPRGSVKNPMTVAELESKFGECANSFLGEEAAKNLFHSVYSIEKTVNIKSITRIISI